jgi:hypothetical protein
VWPYHKQDGERYFLVDGHVHFWNVHPGSPGGQVGPRARPDRTAQLNARWGVKRTRHGARSGTIRALESVLHTPLGTKSDHL